MPEGGSTLTKQEKEAIRKVCGQMSSPLVQTVAKLYVCPRTGNRWVDSGVWGAICLVVDRSLQPPAYLIQILDLQNYSVQFSQELAVESVYNSSDGLFHSYEIDHGFVGFSFVNGTEAAEFGQKVQSAIARRDLPASIVPRTNLKSLVTKASVATGLKLPGAQQGVKIGVPTNFEHKQHIQYNPEKGFECTNIPENWKAVFKAKHVPKAYLQNPAKAAVIFDALQQELGADFLSQPPPVVPPLPAKKARITSASPFPPFEAAAEAPPAAEAAPSAVPCAPDAPPPPPAVVCVAAPKNSARGNLLADIRAGHKLKPVEEEKSAMGPNPTEESPLMVALTRALLVIRDPVLPVEEEEEDDEGWD